MLALGLNIVVDLAGQLVLGYVALRHRRLLLWSVELTRPSAWVLTCSRGRYCGRSFGLGLGFSALRLRGDYLAIVTLGFGELCAWLC